MSEYCYHLWKTVTIDHKGDIYHCCKIKPLNLGSIYKNKLCAVLNGNEIRELRDNSLHSELPCYKSCNLIDKTDSITVDNTEVCQYSNLTDLYLDFGMKCNISCIMCKQRERYKTDKRGLTSDILIRNIDFTPFQNIYLQGGEPLFIDECLKIMDYLSSIGKRYSILTNGILIDDKMAKRLAQEAALVSISLNAATKETHETVNSGSVWETVLENLVLLRKYRDEFGSTLSINGRMTITVNSLTEIPEFIQSFKRFGFDTANFGFDLATVPKYLETHHELKNALSAQITEVLHDTNPNEIDTLRLKQLGLII